MSVVATPTTPPVAATPPAVKLLTAEEFLAKHGDERGVELVKGQVVRYPLPSSQIILQSVPRAVANFVMEVKSPSDGWAKIYARVGDYLAAGVTVVLVIDPKQRNVVIYRDQQEAVVVPADGVLTVPDVLPALSVPVLQFFANIPASNA